MRNVFVLVCALLISSVQAFGDTETLNGLEWKYSIRNGMARVDGVTNTSYFVVGPRNVCEIPSVLGGCPVTEIGELAFYSHLYLYSVVIPSTVTQIGKSAFRYCPNLKSIEIPSSVTNI